MGSKRRVGPEPPAWVKINVPEAWADRTYPTDYRAGYIAGWRSDKAKCPIPSAWPGTPLRRDAWAAGKQRGMADRRIA